MIISTTNYKNEEKYIYNEEIILLVLLSQHPDLVNPIFWVSN